MAFRACEVPVPPSRHAVEDSALVRRAVQNPRDPCMWRRAGAAGCDRAHCGPRGLHCEEGANWAFHKMSCAPPRCCYTVTAHALRDLCFGHGLATVPGRLPGAHTRLVCRPQGWAKLTSAGLPHRGDAPIATYSSLLETQCTGRMTDRAQTRSGAGTGARRTWTQRASTPSTTRPRHPLARSRCPPPRPAQATARRACSPARRRRTPSTSRRTLRPDQRARVCSACLCLNLPLSARCEL